MRRSTFSAFLCAGLFSLSLLSCKNDSYLLTPPPVKNQSFVEEFDTMQNAYNRGWRWLNRSVPVGVNNWGAGPGTPLMMPYSSKGINSGFAYATWEGTAGTNDGIISNWLVSPQLTMQNGDKIVFFTKTELTADDATGEDYSARLQVCFNKDGDLDVGVGDNPGKFDNILLDINPTEEEYLVNAPSPTAYPADWTRFEATVLGLSSPVKGRFAFRYYLHDAGSNGAGLGVGVDSVAYIGKH
jgi:hypothetical protein